MTADDCPDEPETIAGEIADPPGDAPPTFGEVFSAVTPPGANSAALLAALKAAQVTGGQFPGRTAPDISGPGSAVPDIVRKVFPALDAAAPLPEDPFGLADASDIALGEMYKGMLRGGIPLASVERIIAIMLAEMGPGGDRDA